MELHTLSKINGISRTKKRLGRGVGSGKGCHTVGRGNKGQKSRTGYNLPNGFEGGQIPLYKRMPKIGGFKNFRAKSVYTFSIGALNIFEEGSEVTVYSLAAKGLIRELGRKTTVKVLGSGELTKKLTLKGLTYSESAKKALDKAGVKIVE
ncbi:MAG: ribosomal protein L15 [uncultured bacterium]|nr:MAG: ribosomal protein L15 [uncultured bacterium]